MDQKSLKELFTYDSGFFYVKKARRNAFVGKKITGSNTGRYLTVTIDKKSYLYHRLIFLFHSGYLPPLVDHVNRDGFDNRIENLRACDAFENQTNREGCRLEKHPRGNSYSYRFTHKHKSYYRGKFKTEKEAYENLIKFRKQVCNPDFIIDGVRTKP